MPVAAGPYEDGKAAADWGDYETALQKWLPLAEQGNAEAQFMLGNLYREGLGVPLSDTKAVTWYWLAADEGHAHAQLSLGIMYATGRGVTQDIVLAHMWFELAAAQGNRDALSNLKRADDQMTPEQVAEAQRLARKWKPKGE